MRLIIKILVAAAGVWRAQAARRWVQQPWREVSKGEEGLLAQPKATVLFSAGVVEGREIWTTVAIQYTAAAAALAARPASPPHSAGLLFSVAMVAPETETARLRLASSPAAAAAAAILEH